MPGGAALPLLPGRRGPGPAPRFPRCPFPSPHPLILSSLVTLCPGSIGTLPARLLALRYVSHVSPLRAPHHPHGSLLFPLSSLSMSCLLSLVALFSSSPSFSSFSLLSFSLSFSHPSLFSLRATFPHRSRQPRSPISLHLSRSLAFSLVAFEPSAAARPPPYMTGAVDGG